MPIIIYGLGNNESKYLKTKHNAGRLVVEKIASSLEVAFFGEQGCFVAKKKLNIKETEQEIWLIYSAGYMNTSGNPISKLLKYFKVDTNHKDFQLIIAHDDSDQTLHKTKLSVGGGTAGHNGIISSYLHLASCGLEQKDIWRLKIGIRPEGNRLKSETFVLSQITSSELEFYHSVAQKLLLALGEFPNIAKIQNILNT